MVACKPLFKNWRFSPILNLFICFFQHYSRFDNEVNIPSYLFSPHTKPKCAIKQVEPTKGASKRGEASRGNPPESPFVKGGELLPFLKGEREGFEQGEGETGREVDRQCVCKIVNGSSDCWQDNPRFFQADKGVIESISRL